MKTVMLNNEQEVEFKYNTKYAIVKSDGTYTTYTRQSTAIKAIESQSLVDFTIIDKKGNECEIKKDSIVKTRPKAHPLKASNEAVDNRLSAMTEAQRMSHYVDVWIKRESTRPTGKNINLSFPKAWGINAIGREIAKSWGITRHNAPEDGSLQLLVGLIVMEVLNNQRLRHEILTKHGFECNDPTEG